MISYKLISKQLYDHLYKNSYQTLQELQKILASKNQLLNQLQYQKNNNINLSVQLQNLSNKLSQKLQQTQKTEILLTEAKKESAQKSCELEKLNGKFNETLNLYEISKMQKKQQQENCRQLFQKLKSFQELCQTQQEQINSLKNSIEKTKNDNKTIQQQIIKNHKIVVNQFELKLKQSQTKNQNLLKKLQQLQVQIKQKQNEIQIVITSKQFLCKELDLIKELKQYKLKEEIIKKDNWIDQLTKEISFLKQRLIACEVQSPGGQGNNLKIPPLWTPRTQPSPTASSQSQRIKYLSVCKSLLEQFNLKFKKVTHEKKEIQQKYKQIKLKLNQYQYNQFKYKDKLSLLLEKVQKYQKLTKKQQFQLEKFIWQFDQELETVLKIKDQEAKIKLNEELAKYVNNKVTEGNNLSLREEVYNIDRDSRSRIKTDRSLQNIQSNQPNLPILDDTFALELQKISVQNLQTQLRSVKQELEKYKKNNKKLKNHSKNLEQEAYHSSLQIRRFKCIIQQLIKQLQIKSTEIQLLKNYLNINSKVGSEIIQDNQQDRDSYATGSKMGKQTGSEQLIQRISGRLSVFRQSNTGNGRMSSGSQPYEYQISEIDSEFQKKHSKLLNQIFQNYRKPNYKEKKIKNQQKKVMVDKNQHQEKKNMKKNKNQPKDQRPQSQVVEKNNSSMVSDNSSIVSVNSNSLSFLKNSDIHSINQSVKSPTSYKTFLQESNCLQRAKQQFWQDNLEFKKQQKNKHQDTDHFASLRRFLMHKNSLQ